MIGLEMQRTKPKSPAAKPIVLGRAGAPSEVELAFARQLATSVWLLQLGDKAAREAVSAYARARYGNRLAQAFLRAALESEYCLCRERLDLCS